MNTAVYLDTAAYDDMLDKLITVRPTASQPCLRSAIVEILGEIGNVWPVEIYIGDKEIPQKN